jgi:hypothetical protein
LQAVSTPADVIDRSILILETAADGNKEALIGIDRSFPMNTLRGLVCDSTG